MGNSQDMGHKESREGDWTVVGTGIDKWKGGGSYHMRGLEVQEGKSCSGLVGWARERSFELRLCWGASGFFTINKEITF